MAVAGVTVPGYNPNPSGGAYWQNGVYATRQQHEEQARIKADIAAREAAQKNTSNIYAQGSPSVTAANTAASNIQNKALDFTIGPSGQVNLSNESLLAQQQKDRDRAALLALINKAPGGGAPTVTHPGAGNNEAGRAAAFSRAKDQAGQIARSSLTAIAEEMAGRGISGSGIEALREAGAVDDTAGGLTEVIRDQAMSDAARAASVNDQTYQGDIAQRAQDLSNRQSYLALLANIYKY